jgi:hypothetical protein
MKYFLIATILVLCGTIFAQAPYPKFDLGKLKKDYVQFSSEAGPFKKTPANHLYRTTSLNGDFSKRIKGESFTKAEKFKKKLNQIHYSRTFQGDTTSISNSGEYIENLNWKVSENVLGIYLTDIVTNEDWQIFRSYVRDSIARRIVAEEFPDYFLTPTYDQDQEETDMSDWNINWKGRLRFRDYGYSPLLAQMYYSEHERYYKRVQIDERKLTYRYNWTEDEYTSKGPALSMQYPQNYFGKREFLDKLIMQHVALFRDTSAWIIDSTLSHFGNIEDGLVSFYGNHEYYKDKPVTGLNAPQARAYLNWLQSQHQKLLDAKGVKLKVRYKLPEKVPFDSAEEPIEISAFNLENWRISNAEYEEFVKYVRDSIARRTLAEEVPNRYLIPTYDSDLEEKDQSEWDLNWKNPIDWKKKTATFTADFKKKYPKFINVPILEAMFLYRQEGDTNQIVYQYFIEDHKTASLEGNRAVGNPMRFTKDQLRGREPLFVQFESRFITDENGSKVKQVDRGSCYRHFGKDLSLSNLNVKGNSTDVYAHVARSRFIRHEKLLVYPTINFKWSNLCFKGSNCHGQENVTAENQCKILDCEECGEQYGMFDSITKLYDFESDPNAQIKVITFSQFKAYWWWKMRKGEFPVKHENPIIENYMPSKKEFAEIQTGAKVVHPAETHSLPTPGFRCEIIYYVK